MIGPHPFHAVGEKYIVAVRDGAGAIPVLLPVLETPLEVDEILDTVDGILLTGSPSNVSPKMRHRKSCSCCAAAKSAAGTRLA